MNQSPESKLEHALAYARMGWPVVPLHWLEHGTCTCHKINCGNSAGKHPLIATGKGHEVATTDEAQIRQWWGEWPKANIGIISGPRSGLMIFDVDPRNGGDLTLEELLQTHGPLPQTPTVETGRKGLHFYFRLPFDCGDRPSVWKGIDIKAGGIIVAAPSTTVGDYDWYDDSSPFETGLMPTDAPQWVLNALREKGGSGRQKLAQPQFNTILTDEQVHEIRSALAHIAITTAPDDYGTWLNVGMALHSTRAASAFALWCEWSSTVPDKFDMGTCRQKWASFDASRADVDGITIASLFGLANDAGWKRPLRDVRTVEMAKDESELDPLGEDMAFPPELLQIPGRLQMFVDWCLSGAKKPQPKLSIAAAVSLGAALMARRYEWNDTRTSIFQILISPSGSGKDHPRSCIKHMMSSAGLEDRLIGEDFKSAQGLYSALGKQPAGVTLIDEYGMFIEGLTAKNAAQHSAQLPSALMKIASSYRSLVRGAEAANEKLNPRVDIDRPCLSLLGTTTMKRLIAGVTGTQVIDGFFNRHLLVFGDAEPEWRQWAEGGEPPEELLLWARELTRYNPDPANELMGMLGSNPIKLNAQLGVEDLFNAFAVEIEARSRRLERKQTDMGAVWVRAVEQAKKLAIVISGSLWRPGEQLYIRLEAARWAIVYVRYSTWLLEKLAIEHVADSPHEAAVNALLQLALAAGADGLTIRDARRKCRQLRAMDEFQLQKVLKSAAHDGLAGPLSISNSRGPGRAVYVLEQFLES